MRSANYIIEEELKDKVIIRDIGPWDKFPTVTNSPEEVVLELREKISGKRLFYYDSEGNLDELVHEDGIFKGFKPGFRENWQNTTRRSNAMQKTTKEILIQISDLLKERTDVLHLLSEKLHQEPLRIFNSLESAISEASIKDVYIPEEDVAKLMSMLNEDEINQVVKRITDIFNLEWVINPKAIQVLSRNTINKNLVVKSDFVETSETLQIKKDKHKEWEKKNWEERSIKEIKPLENRKNRRRIHRSFGECP